MGDDNTPQQDRTTPSRPKGRWFLLAVYCAFLAQVLITQWTTIGTFDTGHWAGGTLTPATTAERIWYFAPLGAIVLGCVCFVQFAKWMIPETDNRSTVRAWALLATILALVATLCISFVGYLMFYSD